MSKAKSIKTAVQTKTPAKVEADPARRKRIVAFFLHFCGVIALVGGLTYMVDVSKRYIEEQAPYSDKPLQVALVNKPVWMSDFLAQQIAATVPKNSASAFNHDLLVATAENLKNNPWVANVNQVRRVYGQAPGDTLEVDCEFRAPIALVKWGENYWMVDNDGVVLPEKFATDDLPKITIGRDGRTCFRLVTGVHMAPPASGKKWVGSDLAAGLDLVKLFYGKLFLDEVTAIDVGNYAGRIRRADPQMVLQTRYGTQIWWGRPPNTADAFVEVKPSRKLEILRAVVQQYQRIDANHDYLDVRYDNFLVPSAQPTEARTIDDPNK